MKSKASFLVPLFVIPFSSFVSWEFARLHAVLRVLCAGLNVMKILFPRVVLSADQRRRRNLASVFAFFSPFAVVIINVVVIIAIIVFIGIILMILLILFVLSFMLVLLVLVTI